MHGGASTGQRSPEGMERLRQAPSQARREAATLDALLREIDDLMRGNVR